MLSIVVPAYNEAQRIPETLTRMRTYFDDRGEEYEVIVVDDGSSDATVAVVEQIEHDWPQLALLRLEHNQGKGAAVRLGMLAARGELRLFSDADLSTPIEEVERLRKEITGGCQVVIASRAVDGTEIGVHQPGRRELMGKGYNVLLRALVLRGIHDSQCGFKLFTAAAAMKCFEPLRTQRFGFDAEALLRARRAGWEVKEVPVRWDHKDDSRVSALRDSVGTLLDLLKLRFRRI